MKPVDNIENKYVAEQPEQALRRKELSDFWQSGEKYAEITIFNPDTAIGTERQHYEKASRQLRLGYTQLRFCQRRGKLYVERLMHDDESATMHELKILPEYFEAVKSGDKKFELRKDDRDYKVGDIIVLNEWDGEAYTGERIQMKIRYILRDCPEYGLAEGYCIIGF